VIDVRAPWDAVWRSLEDDIDSVVQLGIQANPSLLSLVSARSTTAMPFRAHVEFLLDRFDPAILTLSVVVQRRGDELFVTVDFSGEEGSDLVMESRVLNESDTPEAMASDIQQVLRAVLEQGRSDPRIGSILRGPSAD
jgi:hypothetical protein